MGLLLLSKKVRKKLLMFRLGDKWFVSLFFLSVFFAFLAIPKNVYAAYTCLGGGDHGGADWNPSECAGSEVAGVHTNIGTLTVDTTITVKAYADPNYGSVDISATAANITGTLSADGKGYAGGITGHTTGYGPGGGTSNSSSAGGGYGGKGADGYASYGTIGGSTYGSVASPTDLGSGGGKGSNNGGNGGGAIKITASGTVTVSGTLSANGNNGADQAGGYGSGGGSGGSIYVIAGTITGTGNITVNSGNGGTASLTGGGGGGGRIALKYATAFDPSTLATLTATLGTGYTGSENGSIVIIDTTNNDLYIRTSQVWDANPAKEGATQNYHAIFVQNNATWTYKGYYTNGSDGYGPTINVTNLTVAAGAAISADSQGYPGGDSGSGMGPGGGHWQGVFGGGGGYGGTGGVSVSALGGSTYGSIYAPTDLGSGGGDYPTCSAGAGGGAIRVNASGSVTVDGTLTAKGKLGTSESGTCGGGSGGSIYLTSAVFTGGGMISAGGGNSTYGGGGGGRVAIYYKTSQSWTGGALTAANVATAGTGGSPAAGNGTVVFAKLYTWDGEGTDGTCGGGGGDGNKWSCAANWVGDAVPDSTDAVLFNDTSTKDATIDASFQGTVLLFLINFGYTGTITESRISTVTGDFIQNAGTFVQYDTGASDTLATNLQGYWKMEEGSSPIDDSSANSNTVAVINAIFSTTVVPPTTFSNTRSVSFDGSGDYLNMGDNLAIAQNKGAVSIGAWVNPGTVAGVRQIFGLSTGTSTANSRAQLYQTGNEIACSGIAGDAEAAQTKTTSATNLVAATWYFVACTIDYANDSIKVYVNGTEQTATGAIAFTATATSNTASQRSSIGIDEDKAGYDYGGFIDEVRFYDKLLIADEVMALASGHDASLDISMDINGNFIQTAGIFTASSRALSIAGDINITGGTFTASTGSIILDSSTTSTLACNSASFNKIRIYKSDSTSLTIGTNCTLPLGANPLVYGALATSGPLSGTGTLYLRPSSILTTTFSTGSSLSGFTGISTTGAFTVSGGTVDLSGYSSATFPSTFTLSSGFLTTPTSPGTMTVTGAFTQSGGSFTADTGIVYFSDNFTISGGTFTQNSPGEITFNGATTATVSCNNVIFNKVNITKGGYNLTISSNCSLPLGNSPSSTAGTITNNGTIIVGTGTWTVDGSYTQASGALLNSTGMGLTLSGTLTLSSGSFPQTLTSLSVGGLVNSGNLLQSNLDLAIGYNFNSSLNCGTATFSSITINKPNSNYTITSTGNCTMGSLTLTSVTVSNPASAYTWYISGDFIQSLNKPTGGANLIIELNGTGTQTITQTSGTLSSPLRINKSSGTVQLASSLYTGTTCNLIAGILSLTGKNFVCGSTFTVQNGATLQLYGNELVMTPTLQTGSTVKYTGDSDGLSDSYTLNNWSYSDLTVDLSDSQDTLTSYTMTPYTLTDGLVLYWPMDESSGSVVADTSGNNNNATATNVPIYPGYYGNGRNFNGSTNFAKFTGNNTGISGNAALTLSAWIKPANVTQSNEMIFGLIGSSSSIGVNAGVFLNAGKIGMYFGGCGQDTVATVAQNDNWYHVVAVKTPGAVSSTVTIYVNGTPYSTSNYSSNCTPNITATRIEAGAGWYNSDAAFPYAGVIDDVRAYNRALTSEEVAALFNPSPVIIPSVAVSGNFTLDGGTFVAPQTLNITGNFLNTGGTFDGNGGTVVLNGTNQEITGSTTFASLTKVAITANTLTFPGDPNQLQVVSGTMRLEGSNGQLLSLRSSSSPTQFRIDPQGTRTISYLDVMDSNNVNGTSIAVAGLNITDSGNNTGWAFNAGPQDPSPAAFGPANLIDGSFGNANTPTLTFSLSDPNGGDQVKYQILIDDTQNFSSPLADYTSELGAQGERSFTVGQAEGGGSYVLGQGFVGQTLPNGSYYWKLKAIDSANAESSFSAANGGEIAFKIDATVPTAPGIPSTTTPTNDTTPVWSWTASTDSGGSGLASSPYIIEWCQDSGFSGCGANTATSTTNSYTHTQALSAGIWYVRVRAVDIAGNESEYSGNGTVFVDLGTPTNPTNVGTITPTNDTTPTWSWTASTDVETSLDDPAYYVQWCTNQSFVGCGSNTSTTNNTTFTHSSTLAQDTWYFRVRAKDVAGNYSTYSEVNSSSTPKLGTVIIDTTDPSVPGTPATSSPTNNITPTWSWTVSTDTGGAGLSSTLPYEVSWSTDQAFDTGVTTVAVTTNSFTHLIPLSLDTFYFRVRSLDNAGNYSSYSANGSVLVNDNVAPNVTLSPITPDPLADSTPTITGVATDPDADGTIASVGYQVDSVSGSWTACVATDGTFNSNSEAFSCTVAVALNSGTHTIYVRGIDNESGVSVNVTDTFTIDVTGPTLNVTTTSNPGTNPAPVMTGNTSDTSNLSNIQFQVGSTGGIWNNCVAGDQAFNDPSEIYSCAIPDLGNDGEYVIYIKATDTFGNITTGSITYNLDRVNPTAPGAPAVTPDPTTDTTPTWNWTASTDTDGSGLATNAYSLQWCNNSSFTNCSSNTATSITNSYTHSQALTNGTWYFRVRSVDKAGNYSEYVEGSGGINTTTTVSVPSSISQQTNGEGLITFSTTVSSSVLANSKLRVEYSRWNGAVWSWNKAQILSVTPLSGTVDLNNNQNYQIGSVNSIDTSSGDVELTIVWDTKSVLNGGGAITNVDTNLFKLRVIPNAGSVDGQLAISANFEVDNLTPQDMANLAITGNTTTTATLEWTSPTETNFNHYEIWYGTNQTDVEARSGTSLEWNNSDDANLSTRTTAITTITGLNTANVSAYYFKIWAVDNFGNESTLPTVSLSLNNNPNIPTTLGPTALVNGSYTTSNTPTLTFRITDPDVLDQVRYKIQIDDHQDFSSPVVDYTSDLLTQGDRSYTIPAVSALADASYYWRVKTIDGNGTESNYATANAAAVAFKVSTIKPILELDSPGDKDYVNDTSPEFKWSGTSQVIGVDHYKLEIYNSALAKTLSYDNLSALNPSYILPGNLEEGTWVWTVTVYDKAGNSTSGSRTVYIDTTNPTPTFTVNSLALIDSYKSTDRTPYFSGEVVDNLSGAPNIASGPKSIEINYYKKNLLGLYDTFIKVSYGAVLTTYWKASGAIIQDNSQNTSAKYIPFNYQTSQNLDYGDYKIDILFKDRADNQTTKTFYYQVVESLAPAIAVTPTVSEILTDNTLTPVPTIFYQTGVNQSTIPQEPSVIDRTTTSIVNFAGRIINIPIIWFENIYKNIRGFTLPTLPKVDIHLPNIPPITIKLPSFHIPFQNGVTIPLVLTNSISAVLNGVNDVITDKITNPVVDLVPKIVTNLIDIFDPSPTVISNLKVEKLGKNFALISWDTNHAASSKISYGLSYDYGQDVQSSSRVKHHEVLIENLNSGVTYYYEVMSQGNTYVFDARHEFTTGNEDGITGKEDNIPDLTELRDLVTLNSLNNDNFRENVKSLIPVGLMVVASGFWLISIILSIVPFMRLMNLPKIVLGLLMKKKSAWGIVFDSKSHQGLDKVILTLINLKTKQTYQSLSDVYGRYEFVVGNGEYLLKAEKKGYVFMPQLVSSKSKKDIIYDNLYFGETIMVDNWKKLILNIPMNQRVIAFNQTDKQKIIQTGDFYSKLYGKFIPFLIVLFNVLFYLGFLLSLIFLLEFRSVVNLLVLLFYILVFIVSKRPSKIVAVGMVVDQYSHPVEGAVVRLVNIHLLQQKIPPIVTKKSGHFDFLVNRGKYQILIETQDKKGVYKPVFKSKPISVRDKLGRVGEVIQIKI